MTEAHEPEQAGDAVQAEQPAPKKPRSASLVFRQTVLLCEAFTMFFATLLGYGLVRGELIDATMTQILVGGLALTVLMGWASGVQKRSWGIWVGWAMQLPLLAAGVVDTAITIMGVVYLVVWIAGVRLGGRIDRERAERDAAAAAREVAVSENAADA